MGLIKVLICEDEKLIANRLKRFIEKASTDSIKIQQVHTLADGFNHIRNHKIDLLFLDLNLHGRDGFDILRELTKESFHTIIVSAHTDKAIDAFEYGVLDFIGKPFTEARIKKALDRFEKGNTDNNRYLKYVAVRTRTGTEFIALNRINFIKAAGIYSELWLLDGSSRIYDKPMKQLLKLLPEQFVRIHKSFVVPLERITSIDKRKANTYNVVLQSGEKIPLSRNKRKGLLETLFSKS